MSQKPSHLVSDLRNGLTAQPTVKWKDRSYWSQQEATNNAVTKTFFQVGVNLLKILATRISTDVKFTDCHYFLTKVQRKRKNEGDQNTILWLKNLRVIIYSYLAGNVVNPGYISTDREGLPRALGPQRDYQRGGDTNKIRFVLTILQQSRLIEAWKDPSLSSITCEGVSLDLSEMKKFSTTVLQDMGQKPKKYPIWDSPHFTIKSGPNGPAMVCSVREVIALRDNPQNSNLWEALKYLGGKSFESYVNGIQISGEIPKTILRKLSQVKDVDGKNRVIAMGDYWSQSVLKPLHTSILKMLENQGETDVTYGQSIRPFGSSNHSYFSFDLTSATDRQPITINQIVMEYLYGQDVSDAWKTVMVDTPFQVFNTTETVKYKVGQPMGLYSSWAMLALTHHFLVRYSAKRIGITNFTDYRLQGDDIVIRHDAVAESYQHVMNSIGVEISKEKTLVSKDTFEFAKRLFFKGHEVTGLPQSSLCRMGVTPSDIQGFLQISRNRGSDILQSDSFDLVKTLLNYCFNIGNPKRYNPKKAQCVEVQASQYSQTGEESLARDLTRVLGIQKCVGNHISLLRELLTLLLEDIYREAPVQLDHSSKLMTEYLQQDGQDAVKDGSQSAIYTQGYSPLHSAVDQAYERVLYGGTDIWVFHPRWELELQSKDEMLHSTYSTVKKLDIAGQNPVMARTTRKFNRGLQSVSNAMRRVLRLYVDNLVNIEKVG